MQAFFLCNLLWSIVLTFHVWNDTSKGCLFTDFTSLRWVDKEVSRLNQDITSVFWVTEILLNMNKVLHVLIRGISRLSNVPRRLEWLFVSNGNLLRTILFSHHSQGRLLEWVANGVVTVLAEEDTINFTFLARAGENIGRVRVDLLGVRLGIQAS